MTDRLNRARAMFDAARSHRSLQEAADDPLIESLARLATFSADIATGAPPRTASQAIPLTTKAATELAVNVRRHLGVDDTGPLFELPSLLPQRLHALVFPIRHATVASACALFDEQSVIFVSTDLGYEQLSACARELANLLTRSSREPGSNAASFTLHADSSGRGPREYFGANFAIELLVPTRGLSIGLRKVRELLKVKNRAIGDIEMLYMARIFGVTFSAIARKCERAQLLPLGGAATMEKFLTDKFGGAEQRANDLCLPDRPAVHIPIIPLTLLPAIEHRIKAGGLSHAQAAEALSTSENMLTLVLAQSERTLEGFWQ